MTTDALGGGKRVKKIQGGKTQQVTVPEIKNPKSMSDICI